MIRDRARIPLATALAVLGSLAIFASPAVGSVDQGRTRFEGSIKDVPVGAPDTGPHRMREALTAPELAATLDFAVSLRMRHFDELESRIHSGQRVPQSEMEARYLPSKEDYKRIEGWLESEGFTLTLADSNHTVIFARGQVGRIAAALDLSFARVSTRDGEFTSAVTPPSLPDAIAGPVLGIDGLQPHILMHVISTEPEAVTNVGGRVTPADILADDNAPGNLNGSGQTIAIVMDAAPLSSDLQAFWLAAGIDELSPNFTVIPVSGGPTQTSQSASAGEVTLDTEWSTGIAPGAQLRVYAMPTLSYTYLLAACTQIINDGLAKVVSYSAAGPEIEETASSVQSTSQMFAQLAAAGITMLAGSGDSGSNPNLSGGKGYNASNALSVMYPASDPNVCGVGGTTPTFNSSWAVTAETTWSEIGTVGTNPVATGGGISGLFSRPSWQTGQGVPAGSMRCVPDVASMASAVTTSGASGAFVVLNGQQGGDIGTSLACPTWAGIVALINQARANQGLATLGLLNPWVYPLIGSSAFKDITTGSNGAYSAGVGYDLCTGVGTPNITNLAAQLANRPRLVNLSARAYVGAGSSVLIAGFGLGGSGNKQLLLRGVGPGMASTFGITDSLADVLQGLYDNNQLLIGSDNGWANKPALGSSPVTATLTDATAAIMNSLGAFPYVSNSLDAALYTTLPVGNYTSQISGLGSNPAGVALAEIYDADSGTPTARLVNLSARASIGTGFNIAIAGFAVSGNQSEMVLIRGVGPGLFSTFGLTGYLANPLLQLYDNSGTLMASNSGWGRVPTTGPSTVAATIQAATAAEMTTVGAFPLGANSTDAAMLVTLPPGNYTAQISGLGGTTGIGLVEVYEYP